MRQAGRQPARQAGLLGAISKGVCAASVSLIGLPFAGIGGSVGPLGDRCEPDSGSANQQAERIMAGNYRERQFTTTCSLLLQTAASAIMNLLQSYLS